MTNLDQAIYVAGHRGMVGSAIIRQLEKQGYSNIIVRTRQELDLLNQKEVQDFFQTNEIQHVYLAAARVGGIHANNTYPADFIYQNLMIQANIIHAAFESGVKKLLFLGSSCIYPKFAEQPMKEDSLLTGVLEPTNEPYAIAKIAGIKLCESYNRQHATDYRSAMPTNLYGPNDNFHSENAHVIPMLMRRFHEAVKTNKDTVTIWGTGKPMREFLHVDEMAAASVFIMNLDRAIYDKTVQPLLSHINVGSGVDYTIRELSEIIAKVTKFKGELVFDDSKPDGTYRKLMNVIRLKDLGWESQIQLDQGIQSTYDWFLDNVANLRS